VGTAYARGNASHHIKAASLGSPNKHGRRTVPVYTTCSAHGVCPSAWWTDGVSRPAPYR
jgi:hypothetical protein